MAESYRARATRVAFDVIVESLEALRPSAGKGADQHATKDIERLVGCIISLGSLARNERGNTPETPQKEISAPRGSGSVKGTIGVVDTKPTQLKKKPRSYRKTEYSEEFELQFWRYWNWRGSKEEASALWEQLPIEDKRAIYKDLELKKRGERDPDWQPKEVNGKLTSMVPNCAKYIRRRLWESKWENGVEVASGETPLETRARDLMRKSDCTYEEALASLKRQEANRG